MSVGRKPVIIFEIDLDYCTNTFGSAPCTAALSSSVSHKCFNCFFTCADTANFNKGVLTLRYSMNQSGLPKGVKIYPALKSISTNAAEINLGGFDKRTGAMGKRARVTVELQDFKDNDTDVDKYQAERVSGAAQFSGIGYTPEERGTHFGRLRARHPYYIGRSARLRYGYEGQPLASMRTKNFVLSDWEGPNMDGGVRVEIKDVLDLAENDKALCPVPSTGKLSAAIAVSGTPSVDLVPAGVGSEYATSGRASIGSEIVKFTRSGDTVTFTERAVDGTTASTHSVDDLFQQCHRFEKMAIGDVADELLTTFAGISSGFIPTADWDDEGAWASGLLLTRTISKPTGVLTLMGELGQLGANWWWDDVSQEIPMRLNRPLAHGETLLELSDSVHVIEKSLGAKDLPKQRITQVVFWHGQIDPTDSVTSGENYRRAHVASNDGGNANQHNQSRVVEIFSPWLGDGNDGVAYAISDRLSNRYENTPRQVTFKADAKDRDEITIGRLATMTSRAFQDDTGANLPTEVLITSIEEDNPGHSVKVKAITHQFLGRFGFWLQNPQPDYDTASDDDKEFGAFWFDDNLTDFGDGTGPYLYY